MSIYLCEKFHVWHCYAFDDLKYFIEYSSYLTLNKYTITFAMKTTSKRLLLNVFCIFLLFTNLLVQLWSLCIWNVTLKKKPRIFVWKIYEPIFTSIFTNFYKILCNKQTKYLIINLFILQTQRFLQKNWHFLFDITLNIKDNLIVYFFANRNPFILHISQ